MRRPIWARNILRSVGMATETGIETLATDAARQFETSVAALNTRFSERAVFSGVNADTSPLPEAETLLAALDTVDRRRRDHDRCQGCDRRLVRRSSGL